MKVFRCKQDHVMNTLVVIPILLVFIMILIQLVQSKTSLFQSIMTIGIPIIGLAFLLLPRPIYRIDHQYFYYRSGIFRGKIALDKIDRVEVGKTMWVGFKPASARHGLIIHYHKYNEIYISPANNEDFVQALLQYNPEIEIIRHQA